MHKAKGFVRYELSVYSNESPRTDRATAVQQRRAPGALLDTWLPRERSKAKRIEQTEVRMCQSTQLIWHINWVKRR